MNEYLTVLYEFTGESRLMHDYIFAVDLYNVI